MNAGETPSTTPTSRTPPRRRATKVAESVGGYGEQVTDPEELQNALRRGLDAVNEGRPAIIDVIVQ